jgi:phage replication O-like protein O
LPFGSVSVNSSAKTLNLQSLFASLRFAESFNGSWVGGLFGSKCWSAPSSRRQPTLGKVPNLTWQQSPQQWRWSPVASPQLEDGYTRIANELLEAKARAHFSAAEHSVLDLVLRECYGRNGGQKECFLSFEGISTKTGLPESTTSWAITRLCRRNVLIRDRHTYPPKTSIQKDYEQWKPQEIVVKKATRNCDESHKKLRPLPQEIRVSKKKEAGSNISSKPVGSDGSLFASPDQEPALRPPAQSEKQIHLAAVRGVWDFYIERLGKEPKLLTFTRTRQQKGLARLREGLAKTGGDLEKAAELMRLVVSAVAESAWHMGENPGKERYDSWEGNLFKSQEQFEKWLERANRR